MILIVLSLKYGKKADIVLAIDRKCMERAYRAPCRIRNGGNNEI